MPVLAVIQRIIDEDPPAPGTEGHLFRHLARLCDPAMLKAYAALSGSSWLGCFAELVWLTEPSYAQERARRLEFHKEALDAANELERLARLPTNITRHSRLLASLDPIAARAEAKALRKYTPKPMPLVDAGLAGDDNPKTAFIRQVLAGLKYLGAPIDDDMLRAIKHATNALVVADGEEPVELGYVRRILKSVH